MRIVTLLIYSLRSIRRVVEQPRKWIFYQHYQRFVSTFANYVFYLFKEYQTKNIN